MGQSGEQFLNSFSQNVKHQNESVVEKNVLCQTVLTLMAEGKPYLAKVSEAHETLKSIAKQDAKDDTFPKLPHHLRPSLDSLRASLLEHGVTYQFMERGSNGVKILFTRTDSPDTPSQSVPVTVSYRASESAAGEADEPDEPLGAISEFEFEEIPEVINA